MQPNIESLFFNTGMSTLIDSARSAVYRDNMILLMMDSGAEVRFPVHANPRLARGTPAQLRNIEISPFGLHWPDLDEDLSFRGILAGDYGQHQRVEPSGPANGSQPVGPGTDRPSAAAGSRR